MEYEEKSNLIKVNKQKRMCYESILGLQVDNCLKKDVESVQNVATLGMTIKERKRKKRHNPVKVSVHSNIHNDCEEGSVLVENPRLKSEVGAESVLNKATLGVEKKEKKRKKKHNALEDCSIGNDRKEGSVLVENPCLKSDADVESVQNVATLGTTIKERKRKKKHNVEKVSEYSNIHNDCEEGSVLVENPRLKSEVVAESVLYNATLGVEKKEKKRKKHNALEDCSIGNDRKDGSLLVENPCLKSDADVESVQNVATLGTPIKERKRKKRHNVVKFSDYSNIHNDCEEGSVLVENPRLKSEVVVESVLNNATLGVEKKEEKRKKKRNVLENCSIGNDRKEGSVLVENPCLKSDADVESVQNIATLRTTIKERKRKKRHNVGKLTDYSNIHNDCEEGSVLVENPRLKGEVVVECVLNNATLGVEKKEEKRKKKHNAFEDCSKGNDRKEGSVLVENPCLKSDADVESVQNVATLGTAIKERERKKKHSVVKMDTEMVHYGAEVSLHEEKNTQESTESYHALYIEGKSLKNEKNKDEEHRKRRNALVNRKHFDKDIFSSVSNHLKSGSTSLKENDEPLRVGRSDTCLIMKDVNSTEFSVTPENIKTYQKSKQEQSKTDRKRRKHFDSLGCSLEPIKEDVTMQVPESSLTRKSVVSSGEGCMEQVVAEISVGEASVICEDNQPTSEKSKSRIKAENSEETGNIDSVGEDVSVLSIPMGQVEHTNMGRQDKIQIAVQDAAHVEKVLNESTTCDKEKSYNDPSRCDPSCKLLEQEDVLMKNIEEKEPSLSNLDVIKDDADLPIDNKGNPPQALLPSSERVLTSQSRKKLLILDVNGLLADIVPYGSNNKSTPDTTVSGKKVFKRPFCEEFLQFCLEKFDVGVWSSRAKKNVDKLLNFLMGNLIGKLLFCWDQTHCTQTGFKTLENREKPLVLKELRKLWEKHECNLPWQKGEYNESNTLLLDDSPYKALRNPAHTAIFPHTYRYNDTKDCSLGPGGDLRVYLEGLATCENVQDYVKQNPFGQRPITESSVSWKFYCKIASVDSYQHNVTKARGTVRTWR